jgi:hypothetical protein
VLLHRIVWFEREGTARPSENHCWAIWDRRHRGPPTIAYAGNGELKITTPEILAACSRRNRAGRSRHIVK